MRLVTRLPERFARVSIGNTFLPAGDGMTPVFAVWASIVSQKVPLWGPIVAGGCRIRKLTEQEQYAYDAPFPTEEYKAATRVMPHIVPSTKDHMSVDENMGGWKRLA